MILGSYRSRSPIDADHITICKPKDRSSEIYIHIRNFITRQLDTAHRDTVIASEVKEVSTRIKTLTDSNQEGHSQLGQMILEQGEKTADLVVDRLQKQVSEIGSSLWKYPKDLVDREIQKQLLIVRGSRFFNGFPLAEHSERLAKGIINGEFEGGSDSVKSCALAWCARFLAYSENRAQFDEFVRKARQLGNGPEVTVAEAFGISAHGNFAEALNKLARVESSFARSATFRIVTHHQGDACALEWLEKSGITHTDLDPDGKLFLI